jgi:predicted RNA-binding protein with PIN domain
MALVRILVDGFSLLHRWPALAPGKPFHSAHAREELIARLRRYNDACGTPVTIVFDGDKSGRDPEESPSTADLEILYSPSGQTADHVIERVSARLKAYGEVLVVTDDLAERETVAAFGALTSGCEEFIRTVETEIANLDRKVSTHNQIERSRFRSV